VKEKESNLKQIIPQLKVNRDLMSNTTKTELLEGVDSFVRLLSNLLNYEDDICAFGIPSEAPNLMKYSISRFHNERIRRKINMLHIYNSNAKERISFLNKMKFTSAKYLPAKFNSNVTTVVCGEEVIIVSWENPVSSVRIKSESFANAYRNYFSLLWMEAKKD
jgi:hypothetical protein